MDFSYKNVLIYGYSKSGKAVENVLKDIKVSYNIYDDNIKLDGGAYIIKLTKKIIKQFDLIVLSPGVSIFNKWVKFAEKENIKVISELEFGFWFTSAPIIGVTGTNGKTTTVSLITSMLKKGGYSVASFGNIGTPLSEAYKKHFDYLVVECSSFQLEAIDKFKCKIGVLLNVDSDHLDRHKTLKNYINCKTALFNNSVTSDYSVLNFDDNVCYTLGQELVTNNMYFSTKKVINGIYLKGNSVYSNINNETTELINLLKNKIINPFTQNILATICVGIILDIKINTIKQALKEYEILPHRMEFVTKTNNITYINDSKSTNVHSVKNALDLINGNIILLLGGKNKKLDFTTLLTNLPHTVKKVILFGDCRKELFLICTKHKIKCEKVKSIDMCVERAIQCASSGDTILFSPGATSFDEFNSYAERGDYFKSCVFRLNGKNKEENIL